MTEALAPEPHHRVLEIGTGSGYQTAILAQLCGDGDLDRAARRASPAGRAADCATLGVTNVQVVVGDGTEGLAGGRARSIAFS